MCHYENRIQSTRAPLERLLAWCTPVSTDKKSKVMIRPITRMNISLILVLSTGGMINTTKAASVWSTRLPLFWLVRRSGSAFRMAASLCIPDSHPLSLSHLSDIQVRPPSQFSVSVHCRFWDSGQCLEHMINHACPDRARPPDLKCYGVRTAQPPNVLSLRLSLITLP